MVQANILNESSQSEVPERPFQGERSQARLYQNKMPLTTLQATSSKRNLPDRMRPGDISQLQRPKIRAWRGRFVLGVCSVKSCG